MSQIRTIACAMFVVLSAGLMGLYIQAAQEVQRIRTDLAELRDVRYGLLDASVWVEQVSTIIKHRIDEFELSPENRPALKRQLEKVMERLLLELEARMEQRSQEGNSEVVRAWNRMTSRIRELLIPFEELKSDLPRYADAVLTELSTPEAKADIKELVTEGLYAVTESTFSATDRSRHEAVLAAYECTEAPACEHKLESLARERHRVSAWLSLGCLVLCLAVFVLATFKVPVLTAAGVVATTAAIFVALVGGISTPMIEIEAKISSLQMQVLGDPVVFENQVLYFQSKSVIDVVELLARTGAPDMIFVAFLVALFSVVFPAIKLVAGYLYFQGRPFALRSDVIKFFALYSSKWSMADVMVVAIFMAFIGFEGLVSSQLDSLAGSSQSLEILTTNGTSLMPGYYLFLGFCLGGLALSSLLERHFARAAAQ